MKKYLFLSLILVLITPNITLGFLSDPLWLDMYKNIDDWIYNLELKFIQRELNWGNEWKWIRENIISQNNSIKFKDGKTLQDCLKPDINIEDVNKIYNDDINTILKLIDDSCKDEKWNVEKIIVSSIASLFKYTYDTAKQSSENKVSSLYKVWRIWMYSDWIEENSPFDLMVDLENIDKVIFEQKILYNWVNFENLWKVVWWVTSWLSTKESYNLYKDKIIFEWKYSDREYNPIYGLWNIYSNENSSWACFIDNSWLNKNSLNSLLWKLELDDFTKNTVNDNNSNTWDTNNNNIFANKWQWYTNMNDNSVWPCYNFFCITVKFVSYNYKLLWGWKDLSIEWLLKRSNNHLKKFANSYLWQSNMTINFFELWLKDLDLANMFYVWVNVSKKPVPLLNLDYKPSQEKKKQDVDWNEFSSKNMLYTYYKNLWLDYDRANDLDIFSRVEWDKKSVIDATDMQKTISSDKFNKYNEYIDKAFAQNNYISSNVIDKKVLYEDMNNFYTHFLELERFTSEMQDYTIKVNGVVNGMNKITKD